ncbi:MAG TPA: peptidase S10 [Hyphomonadaceae bacterium]|nr:peptidase S10 [Hyphomonadaceae bacterium]
MTNVFNRREAAALIGAAAFAACQTATAAPQNPPTGKDVRLGAVTSRKRGTFNGVKVDYDAIVEPIPISDASGKPIARIISTSYLSAKPQTNRPVLFVFNGGPISASSVLHMGAMGPKRIAIPDDITAAPSTFRVVDNTYALLDIADIVFFDPASTGLSRVADGVDSKSQYSATADGQQAALFVTEWSRRHNRMDAPKYVLGESYGTIRAAVMANQLLKSPTPLRGVIVLGQALNIVEFSQRPQNIVSYVVSLPTLAAAAHWHGKGKPAGRSLETFTEDAWRFAQSDYMPALFKGRNLDEATKQKIANELEAYSGLPASWYMANNIRISKENYRRELFRAEGVILGQTDARYKGPNPDGRGGDPSRVIATAYQDAFIAHMRDELGVAGTADYQHAAPDAPQGLDGWDYGGKGPFADWPFAAQITPCFAADPKFRVLVGNGYHDTQTTVGAARYMVDQSGWPADRTTLRFYPGGHMTYSIEASLKAITGDIRAMLTA